MDPRQFPTPEENESLERYTIRCAKIVKDMEPDDFNETVWSTWKRYRGPTLEERIAAKKFSPDKYNLVPGVCVFAEHETTTQKGEHRKYRLRDLVKIVKGNNERIYDADHFPAIADGHTSDENDPNKREPTICGYAGNYRLGIIGRKNRRWAIFQDEYQLKKAADILEGKPRRSVELWTFNDGRAHFDPVAALGAEAPRLPLPQRYSSFEHKGATVERYSYAAGGFASPSVGTVQVATMGKKAKKQPAKYANRPGGSISPMAAENSLWTASKKPGGGIGYTRKGFGGKLFDSPPSFTRGASGEFNMDPHPITSEKGWKGPGNTEGTYSLDSAAGSMGPGTDIDTYGLGDDPNEPGFHKMGEGEQKRGAYTGLYVKPAKTEISAVTHLPPQNRIQLTNDRGEMSHHPSREAAKKHLGHLNESRFKEMDTYAAEPAGEAITQTQGDQTMPRLAPEDLREIVAAIAETPQFKFLTQLMEERQGGLAPGSEDDDLNSDPTMDGSIPEEGGDDLAGLDDALGPEDDSDFGGGGEDLEGGEDLGGGEDIGGDTGEEMPPEGDEGSEADEAEEGEDDENPQDDEEKFHMNAAQGATLERYAQLQKSHDAVVEKYQALQRSHDEALKDLSRVHSRVQSLERVNTDHARRAKLNDLKDKFGDFVDMDEECTKCLYSMNSKMSDDEFSKHVATVEKYAAKAKQAAVFIPSGDAPKSEPETLSPERYSQAMAVKDAALKIHAEALSKGKHLSYDECKQIARERMGK